MVRPPLRPHRRSAAAGLLGMLASLSFGAGFGTFAGCYAERVPPSTFRYQCSQSNDCDDGEACRGGICERTCTLATAMADCGTAYATCFNGACANTCEVGSGNCPSVQECFDLSALGIDLGGGNSTAMLGICGRTCDDSNNLCGGEEVCVAGFCVATCDVTAAQDPCSEGLSCIPPGVCAPSEVGGSDGLGTNVTGAPDETSSTGGTDSSTGQPGGTA